jgi:hypothetical protein
LLVAVWGCRGRGRTSRCGISCWAGPRSATVLRLIDVPGWIDAVAAIDETPAGDAFLEGIGGDGGRLPVSIAFEPEPGGLDRWPRDPLTGLEGVQRTRVRLTEIAVVDAAQYEGAYTYSRGHLAGMAAIGRRDPRIDRLPV